MISLAFLQLRFEGLRSPFIYPMYGLAELPQAFARLSAVYGGTYMLHQKDARVLFDDNGVATGVEASARLRCPRCCPAAATAPRGAVRLWGGVPKRSRGFGRSWKSTG